jgi:hypothetical protein
MRIGSHIWIYRKRPHLRNQKPAASMDSGHSTDPSSRLLKKPRRGSSRGFHKTSLAGGGKELGGSRAPSRDGQPNAEGARLFFLFLFFFLPLNAT